jgi:L-malate glycosyltransferase
MRLVLIGDGESPHLLKWARALATRVELWAASSRGFLPGFDEVLPRERRLALNTTPRFEGGNVALLATLPRLVPWLKAIDADWIHAHYLSSHGTLAWLARRLGVKARIVGSAWGSDILVTPAVSRPMRWLTTRVLKACTLTTSDSKDMAERMRALGADEVMVFPFGLEALPPMPAQKDDALFFANRGLEAIYAPQRVVDVFAAIAADWPQARLVVANDGALAEDLRRRVHAAGLGERVQFVGRLDAAAQAQWYARARWYLSLPRSDSVSVSVLEAMAYGCIPILSNLPANRELVEPGRNGLVLSAAERPRAEDLRALLPSAQRVAAENRAWISARAIFPDAVGRFVQRLQQLGGVA